MFQNASKSFLKSLTMGVKSARLELDGNEESFRQAFIL